MASSSRGNQGPGWARKDGMPTGALSLAIVGLVILIVGGGAILLLRGGSNGDDDQAAIPSPPGTSELVLPTDTPTPPREAETATPTDGTQADATPTPQIATPTDTESDAAAPSPTEEDVEPTPTTEESQVDPTATESPEPEPTEAPFAGDFGTLPPAQLPSGGGASTLTLEYQLAMSLEALPDSGAVYLLGWPVHTYEDVELASDRLGLQGQIVEEGVGVYRVEGDAGSLYVSPNETIFRAAGTGGEGELPDDATAIAIGREWIGLSGFVGDDVDAGAVVGRDDDAQLLVVKFRPIAPQPNLAPNPAATLNIGPGGSVLEVRIAWPSTLTPSAYGYSDPLDLWRAVEADAGFVEADVSSVFATGQLTGAATITDYSTAYTLAGSPATQQFLVPVIVFEGSARIDQTGDLIPVYISIPAVYHQEGTAG